MNYVYIISKHYTSLWHHHQQCPFYRSSWPFWTQRFLNAMGCCVHLEGGWESWAPMIFAAANVPVFCFLLMSDWEIFYTAAFMNRQFDMFFFHDICQLSGEIDMSASLSLFTGLAFPSVSYPAWTEARRCGHVLGVVSVTFVTWWWASSTFPGSKQITASILQADQTASWSFSYFFWLGVWFDFCKSCQLVKQVSGFLLLIHFLIVVELLWLMLLSFTYIWQYLIRHV